jgi:hypothetical protein
LIAVVRLLLGLVVWFAVELDDEARREAHEITM